VPQPANEWVHRFGKTLLKMHRTSMDDVSVPISGPKSDGSLRTTNRINRMTLTNVCMTPVCTFGVLEGIFQLRPMNANQLPHLRQLTIAPTIDKPPKGELWDDQDDRCRAAVPAPRAAGCAMTGGLVW
jgi:hypothetical protein